jgi:thioredoxin 1
MPMSVRVRFSTSRYLWLGIALCGTGLFAFAGCDGAPVGDRKQTGTSDVVSEDGLKKLNPDSRVYEVTDDNFDEMVLKSFLPVVVEFGAVWCGPCQMMEPVLKELASDFHGKVRFCKVDVDQSPRTSDKLVGGGGIPLLLVFKKGEVIARQPGYSHTLKAGVANFLNRIDNLPKKKNAASDATSDSNTKESDASKSDQSADDRQPNEDQPDQKRSGESDKK